MNLNITAVCINQMHIITHAQWTSYDMACNNHIASIKLCEYKHTINKYKEYKNSYQKHTSTDKLHLC